MMRITRSSGRGEKARSGVALVAAVALAAVVGGALAGCSSDPSRTEAARQVNPSTIGLGPSAVRMPGGRF